MVASQSYQYTGALATPLNLPTSIHLFRDASREIKTDQHRSAGTDASSRLSASSSSISSRSSSNTTSKQGSEPARCTAHQREPSSPTPLECRLAASNDGNTNSLPAFQIGHLTSGKKNANKTKPEAEARVTDGVTARVQMGRQQMKTPT